MPTLPPPPPSSHARFPGGAGRTGAPRPSAQRCAVRIALAMLGFVSGLAHGAGDDVAFFESRIWPVLAERCHECHGPEKQKGGLRLDTRALLLRGGENGPVVVPGQPEASRLVMALQHTNADLRMPPKQPLPARQVADLTDWIRRGAPWRPVADTGDAARTTPRSAAEISAADRSWWSFRPVQRPPLPPGTPPALHPIDAFVRHRLAGRGLEPNPPATRRELIRRLSFDLLGLPPTPEAIAAFEADPAPDAWERLVDAYLARPEYGERWARHWLDVVRYAQSNGYERDGEKPYAWRYRDYVIRAFNHDLPYDRFILEQLAGDELADGSAEAVAATGFARLGVWDDEPDDKLAAEFDELDDVVSTTSAAFLGLTLGCARCHEHKFDPLPQADYYSFLAFFRGLRSTEGGGPKLDAANFAPHAAAARVTAWRREQEKQVAGLTAELAAVTNAALRRPVQARLDAARQATPPFEWTLAVRERTSIPPVQVLRRGNPRTPGPEVAPAFPAVLGGAPPRIQPGEGPFPTSGRRRALAAWIASPANPLTARVLVNRVWHHHFGRGLVRTTTDFGRAGVPPTHPELLDWLADAFVARGWSLKQLHRLILTSETWKQSSQAASPAAQQVDPGNELLWRQNLRRLEAEALRDSLLALSGQLQSLGGGPSFFPQLSGEVLAGGSRPGIDWQVSPPAQQSRRSIYGQIRRTVMTPLNEVFDYSNVTSPLGERTTTTVAPQALLLLNDRFLDEQAAALAARLRREASPGVGADPGTLIQRGWALVTGRPPTDAEAAAARGFFDRQTERWRRQAGRLTFQPDVPDGLHTRFQEILPATAFLRGPATGWSYFKGNWPRDYEGIRGMESGRGPFALWTATTFSNAIVTARLEPHLACESVSLLVRSRATGDADTGYEVMFSLRDQHITVRRGAGKTAVPLTTVAAMLPAEGGFPVRVELAGGRLRIAWGIDPAVRLEVHDPQPVVIPGQLGLRIWGAAASVSDLNLTVDDREIPVGRLTDVTPPADHALESLCLLLLNLNEVVYVD